MKNYFPVFAALSGMSVCALAADEKKSDAGNTGRNARDRSAETKMPVTII